MTSAFRSTVYVRIRRRWLGVRVLTWSGKVHVWEGAAEAVLVPERKGAVSALPAGSPLLAGILVSRPFTAFAHPRLLIDGLTETRAVLQTWLRLSGVRSVAGATVVFHVLDFWEGGLGAIELRALLDLGKQIGARNTIVLESGPELSDPDLIRLAKMRNVPLPYRPADAFP